MDLIFRIACVTFLSVTLLLACTPQSKVDVDAIPKAYFTALQASDFDQAMTFYADEFFQNRPRELWRQQLEKLITELGPITAVSFRNKQADTRFSGKFYIYQYDTVHGDKRAKHILTLIRPVDSDEIKFVGHKIQAQGLDF